MIQTDSSPQHLLSPSSACSSAALSPLSAFAAGVVARMRTSLLGRAAVFAALLALSTCLTGKARAYPELDEEIDFLSAIISEQRTESRMPAPASPDLKVKQLIEPSSMNRGSPTEQPTSLSTTLKTTAPPSITNQSPGLLGDPLITAQPSNDHMFIIMSSVFIAAGSLALVIAGVCWVRLQKGVRVTQKVDYPAYSVIKPQTMATFPGDKKLAHSAQMYHYQHQKQQMLSLEKSRDEPRLPDSGASTDEENEDGDFTVYECPGLAPTGEMEVKNPLFDDSNLYLQRFHK
ncbi:neural proliferation differentiation and control protein 1 [Fundulus heteroclitus]|uniref:neural proliferation differentiation and control protein 1 n=1 Tax=Fundulus heteroclitus TaxID=8078 RepID=UPI00165B4AC9|nr:neural proliferation differentiation and control protein 1 [Fundulus heteroclitus]